MNSPWNIARLRALIAEQIEESLTLDYKSGAALAKSDSAKREITKDVSAFANSAGGTLIYGIQEGDSAEDRHLPKSFSAVRRGDISREWLEQVIANIRPRIEGLTIHPIPVGNSEEDVVYVVEVPQSETAHQAGDFRYYKRWNFESVPMHDHEVRDVMSRRKHPKIVATAQIACETRYPFLPIPGNESENVLLLTVALENQGRVVANHVVCFIDLPKAFAFESDKMMSETVVNDGLECNRFVCDNSIKDMVGGGQFPKYGPARPFPILPELNLEVLSVQFRCSNDWHPAVFQSPKIKLHWQVHGDDAAPQAGIITFDQIPWVDRRKVRRQGDVWEQFSPRA